MRVGYVCKGCGVKDLEVPVRDREIDEDLIAWVHGPVALTIGKAHHEASPECAAAGFDLMLPVPAGTTVVGRPVLQ